MKELIKDPWKKKEPGSRLSKRAAVEGAKGIIEHAQMEENSRKFARCWFLGLGFKIKRSIGVQVLLKRELTVEEIETRINKAFGNLVKVKKASNFQVLLWAELDVEEIEARIDKAFEDLV